MNSGLMLQKEGLLMGLDQIFISMTIPGRKRCSELSFGL